MDQQTEVSDTATFVGYHGTSKVSKQKIIEEEQMTDSDSDTEWLGRGVYFFIKEYDPIQAKNNAKMWATHIKKLQTREADVVECQIVNDQDKLFDLNDRDARRKFHKYRNEIFRRACAKVDRENATRGGGPKKKLKETFLNSKAFDCYVFNRLCPEYDIKIVVQDVYINFLKKKFSFPMPVSDVPNCTIACIKDNNYIISFK